MAMVDVAQDSNLEVDFCRQTDKPQRRDRHKNFPDTKTTSAADFAIDMFALFIKRGEQSLAKPASREVPGAANQSI